MLARQNLVSILRFKFGDKHAHGESQVKFHQFILLVQITLSVSNTSFASQSSLSSIPEGPDLAVFSYLSPEALFEVGVCSRYFDSRVVQYLQSPEKAKEKRKKLQDYLILRSEGTQTSCPLVSIDEYLKTDADCPISRILGLNHLIKKDQTKLLKLILKSAPQKHEPLGRQLETFYKNTLQIEKTLASLPSYDRSEEKLAAVFIQLLIWTQVRDQVWAPVAHHIKSGNQEEAGRIMDKRLGDDASDQIRDQLAELIKEQVGTLSTNQLKDHTMIHIWTQIWQLMMSKLSKDLGALVNENLEHFKLATDYDQENLEQLINPAVDYTFIAFQYGFFSWLFSEEYESLHASFSGVIAQIIPQEQIEAVLDKLEIPASHESYLVRTHLELIRQHLTKGSDS
ncbi:MAG: hypothetical protein HRU09_21065 [Oligoflexales bacterium]|nr:hypothetical protein [Oligoflexales bacterium]